MAKFSDAFFSQTPTAAPPATADCGSTRGPPPTAAPTASAATAGPPATPPATVPVATSSPPGTPSGPESAAGQANAAAVTVNPDSVDAFDAARLGWSRRVLLIWQRRKDDPSERHWPGYYAYRERLLADCDVHDPIEPCWSRPWCYASITVRFCPGGPDNVSA